MSAELRTHNKPTIADLVWEVHDLILKPEVLRRWREKVRQWAADYDAQVAEDVALLKWRDKYVERVLSRPRLRNEAAEPRKKGCRFETFRKPEKNRPLRGVHPPAEYVSAWVPPKRSLDDYPKARLPLPAPGCEPTLAEEYAILSVPDPDVEATLVARADQSEDWWSVPHPDGEATLIEQYAALAAVHDCRCGKKARKVVPNKNKTVAYWVLKKGSFRLFRG